MMKKILSLIQAWLVIFLFLVFSCSKNNYQRDHKFTLEQFEKLAHETTSGYGSGKSGPNFSDYAHGVNILESKLLKFERVSFLAISFDSEEKAAAEAKRLNQYYARNWLFDWVEGEPILEEYVIRAFKAINPNRKVQRVFKTSDETPAAVHH